MGGHLAEGWSVQGKEQKSGLGCALGWVKDFSKIGPKESSSNSWWDGPGLDILHACFVREKRNRKMEIDILENVHVKRKEIIESQDQINTIPFYLKDNKKKIHRLLHD